MREKGESALGEVSGLTRKGLKGVVKKEGVAVQNKVNNYGMTLKTIST